MQDNTFPVLPLPGQRNILITSALPYVNATPSLFLFSFQYSKLTYNSDISVISLEVCSQPTPLPDTVGLVESEQYIFAALYVVYQSPNCRFAK